MNRVEVYHKIVPCPKKPEHLPASIKWLSGEGCGSWFNIEEEANTHFLISRYSPDGNLECRGIFKQISGDVFDLHSEYEFTYLSHCAEVNLIQNKAHLKFNLISKTI